MFKVGIVGIDNTGKTSIVRSLGKLNGIEIVHLTTHQYNQMRVAHSLGTFFGRLARYGEKRKSKTFTGLAYLLHLIPYYLELKSKKKVSLLISDRDPILDTLCYSHYYLWEWLFKCIKRPLRFTLEKFFSYPDILVYLDVSPEISINRDSKRIQLHEKAETLARLRSMYHDELNRIKNGGTKIVLINTDNKSLDEVTLEIKTLLPSSLPAGAGAPR